MVLLKLHHCLKTTVENPRSDVKKLSSKESVEGLLEENPEGALALPLSTVSAPKALS